MSKLLLWLRHEPVVILGVIGSIIAAYPDLGSKLTQVRTLRDLAPIVAAILARRFVYPAAKVEGTTDAGMANKV